MPPGSGDDFRPSIAPPDQKEWTAANRALFRACNRGRAVFPQFRGAQCSRHDRSESANWGSNTRSRVFCCGSKRDIPHGPECGGEYFLRPAPNDQEKGFQHSRGHALRVDPRLSWLASQKKTRLDERTMLRYLDEGRHVKNPARVRWELNWEHIRSACHLAPKVPGRGAWIL